jgi:L-ribulose-5-phosphate 3-epimerase
MSITRRQFVTGAVAAPGVLLASEALARSAGKPGIRLGICDWSGGASGLAALDAAKVIGLEGVQISPSGASDKLSYADPAVQAAYRKKSKETGIAVASLALTISNEFPIADDPRAAAWIEQTIDAAHDLGCKAILLAFFGNGDLTRGRELRTQEIDRVVAKLKAAAPRARKRGVVLGIESYLPAGALLDILKRVGSEAVGVYYDIANSTTRGYDVPAEIRLLKGRICEFHFKDYKGTLGTGVDLPAIGAAIKEIGYKGWIVLEQAQGTDLVGYFRQNAGITRRLFGLKEPVG